MINQWGEIFQDIEEDKHQSEARRCKSIQDMDFMRVDIRILFDKFEIAENHDLGKMQNLASEIQIK